MEFNDFFNNNTVIIRGENPRELWVSNYIISKFCGVSPGYLTKARCDYKSSVTVADKIGYGRTVFLPNSGKAWRWCFHNGQYYYNIDSIPDRAPTYYRSKLPDKNTILMQVQAIPLARLPREAIQRKLCSFFNNNEISVFYEAGLTKIEARRMFKTAGWIRLIKYICKFGLYKAYGFEEFYSFINYCMREIKARNMEVLYSLTPSELMEKMTAAPDHDEELIIYLIDLKSKA